MQEKCLYYFAKLESDSFNTDKQQDNPQRNWNQDNWWLWCTEKYIEHLKGDAYWCQFDQSTFGSVKDSEKLIVLEEQFENFKNSYDGNDVFLQDEEPEFITYLNKLV